LLEKVHAVTGEWRLHSEEMGWDVARMGEMNRAYRNLAVKPEGRRPLVSPRFRWANTIKQ
jgi:hypothetical protein